jgi:hypothetical protein
MDFHCSPVYLWIASLSFSLTGEDRNQRNRHHGHGLCPDGLVVATWDISFSYMDALTTT